MQIKWYEMVGTVSTVAKLMYIPVITLATMTSGNVHIHCTILFSTPPSTLPSPPPSPFLLFSLTTVAASSLSPVPLPPHLFPPSLPLLPLPLTSPPPSPPPYLSSSLLPQPSPPPSPLPPHLSSRYNHSVSNL